MKEGTYYAKNAEARRAYQLDFYNKNRAKILRAEELKRFLNPEVAEAKQEYQRTYYLKNRAALKAKRREAYLKKKAAGTL